MPRTVGEIIMMGEERAGLQQERAETKFIVDRWWHDRGAVMDTV